MRLKCKVGDLVHTVDVRNTNLQCDNLLGLSMTKEFRPSTSNIVGTDLSKYKVVGFNQFAVDFMSAIRVHRMPIAINRSGDDIIVSPAYGVFAVNDESIILPEYLMLWFSRSEFDRYADFKSDSAIRGGFDWSELCNTDIILPPIEEQIKIVRNCQVISDRIELLRSININLETQALTIVDNATKGCSSKRPLYDFGKVLTGKTPPTETSDYYGTDVPFIKTPDMHGNLYIVTWESALSTLGADSQANKYLPPDTVIVSCIGANAGEVSLTSCVAQTNQQINAVITSFPKYLYIILKKSRDELRALGDAGSTMININKSLFENFHVVSPDKNVLEKTEKTLCPIFETVKSNLREMVLLDRLKGLVVSRLSVGI